MPMSKVSVIIAIYNVSKYLDKCLKSLHEQTYQDVEFLCINDGSTDDSQIIIDKYCKLDKRFKSYIKENGGAADARNFGIEKATGEYIMHMDGDDRAEPKFVEAAVFYMERFKLDMFIFGYKQFTMDGDEEVIHLKVPNGIYNISEHPEILVNTPNASWNKIYRKELYDKYDIKYPKGLHHEDLATTFRLMYHAKKIGYNDRPLYDYLVDRKGNVTSSVNESIYDIIKVCDILVNYYKDHEAFDKYYDELECIVQRNYTFALKKLMRYPDKEFGDKFIDAIFRSKGQNFKRKNKKYRVNEQTTDEIYRHKAILKMYFHHKVKKHG